jgi:hypothetical protein
VHAPKATSPLRAFTKRAPVSPDSSQRLRRLTGSYTRESDVVASRPRHSRPTQPPQHLDAAYVTRAEKDVARRPRIGPAIASSPRLHALAADELAAYCQDGETRVHIDGPNLLLEPNAAQTIAVTLHELATNAAKYGALSGPNGHVDLLFVDVGLYDDRHVGLDLAT